MQHALVTYFYEVGGIARCKESLLGMENHKSGWTSENTVRNIVTAGEHCCVACNYGDT